MSIDRADWYQRNYFSSSPAFADGIVPSTFLIAPGDELVNLVGKFALRGMAATSRSSMAGCITSPRK